MTIIHQSHSADGAEFLMERKKESFELARIVPRLRGNVLRFPVIACRNLFSQFLPY